VSRSTVAEGEPHLLTISTYPVQFGGRLVGHHGTSPSAYPASIRDVRNAPDTDLAANVVRVRHRQRGHIFRGTGDVTL
jgi:hypothetical protein